MSLKNKLTPSLEDYLETIYVLERKNRVARVKEIANALQVQMPSVSGAVKSLKDRGLVNYEKNSYISLTQKGMTIAVNVQNKHTVLTDFLSNILLLEHGIAEEQACLIEHSIDSVTAKRLANFSEYIKGVLKKNGTSAEELHTILESGVS